MICNHTECDEISFICVFYRNRNHCPVGRHFFLPLLLFFIEKALTLYAPEINGELSCNYIMAVKTVFWCCCCCCRQYGRVNQKWMKRSIWKLCWFLFLYAVIAWEAVHISERYRDAGTRIQNTTIVRRTRIFAEINLRAVATHNNLVLNWILSLPHFDTKTCGGTFFCIILCCTCNRTQCQTTAHWK